MKTFSQVKEVKLPYVLADEEESGKIVNAFDGYVSENHPNSPVLSGKVFTDNSGNLVGSTPHARSILANEIIVGDLERELGFHVATPNENAVMFNDEMYRIAEEMPCFFKNNWNYDTGLWILNPHAKTEINEENAWNCTLANSIFDRMGERKVYAVPDSVIKWEPSAKDRIPFGYLVSGGEEQVKTLDWNEEDVREGFQFHKFDINQGVPNKSSKGDKMNRFYGLRKNLPANALYVYYGLDASGGRYFDNSYEGIRVVFNVSEADAEK